MTELSAGLLDINSYAQSVNSYLNNLIPTGHPLYRIARNVLTGGRRIRATLALLSCEVACGDYKPALPIAAAYELAHAAALVQDDIFDKAAVRRGVKTVWAEYDIVRAVLTMDILLFTIPEIIGKYVLNGLPRSRIYQLLKMLGGTSRDAALGEGLDLELAERETVPLEDYIEMARLKTGSLLAAPAACGAIVGGGTESQVNALYRFGELLGTAYQIIDDILDVTGTQEKTGKPAMNDLRNRKLNAVIILALGTMENGGSKVELDFMRSLRTGIISEEHLSIARKIITQSGSLKRAGDLALNTINQAQRELEHLADSEAKRKILELSAQLARRYE